VDAAGEFYMDSYDIFDAQNFHGHSQAATGMLHSKRGLTAVHLELTWQYPLSEFRSKQTRAALVS